MRRAEHFIPTRPLNQRLQEIFVQSHQNIDTSQKEVPKIR